MLIVIGYEQRLVEERLLRLEARNSMEDPILVGVAFVPLEARARPEALVYVHLRCIRYKYTVVKSEPR
jgi:hypothetical protein